MVVYRPSPSLAAAAPAAVSDGSGFVGRSGREARKNTFAESSAPPAASPNLSTPSRSERMAGEGKGSGLPVPSAKPARTGGATADASPVPGPSDKRGSIRAPKPVPEQRALASRPSTDVAGSTPVPGSLRSTPRVPSAVAPSTAPQADRVFPATRPGLGSAPANGALQLRNQAQRVAPEAQKPLASPGSPPPAYKPVTRQQGFPSALANRVPQTSVPQPLASPPPTSPAGVIRQERFRIPNQHLAPTAPQAAPARPAPSIPAARSAPPPQAFGSFSPARPRIESRPFAPSAGPAMQAPRSAPPQFNQAPAAAPRYSPQPSMRMPSAPMAMPQQRAPVMSAPDPGRSSGFSRSERSGGGTYSGSPGRSSSSGDFPSRGDRRR